MINVHDAKTNFSKLLDMAHGGQEIILAKAGKPYARLMPIAQSPTQREPGCMREINTDNFFDALPDDEIQAWEGS